MIVAWPSASKSVQSIATVMLDRLPTTYGTQRTSKASTSMPGLDSSRSTCLMACLVRRPRASARPWPIMATASKADSIAPRVAPASESTRLACRSSANSVRRNWWTPSNESGFLVGIVQPRASNCRAWNRISAPLARPLSRLSQPIRQTIQVEPSRDPQPFPSLKRNEGRHERPCGIATSTERPLAVPADNPMMSVGIPRPSSHRQRVA